MSADKSKAEVFAGWIEGRVYLHEEDRDAIAAELRRLSASEAALIKALEDANEMLRLMRAGLEHRIKATKEARNA